MLLTKIFKGLQCTITYSSSHVQCLFLINTMEFKLQAFFFTTNCCCKFPEGLLVINRVYELLQAIIKAGLRREQAISSEKVGGSHLPGIFKDYKDAGYGGYGHGCKPHMTMGITNWEEDRERVGRSREI
ncbi:hypothetical protein Bca4012_063886 [Brassica carinata]|uniref:Uncharacterized protein n=1 Tax=Brassica carinata TaxID=52824 RepID=A0A8X7SEA5_BRACI|nr:hypothetical protein Bca52824_033621 [Brassica carinata]